MLDLFYNRLGSQVLRPIVDRQIVEYIHIEPARETYIETDKETNREKTIELDKDGYIGAFTYVHIRVRETDKQIDFVFCRRAKFYLPI